MLLVKKFACSLETDDEILFSEANTLVSPVRINNMELFWNKTTKCSQVELHLNNGRTIIVDAMTILLLVQT